MSLGRSHDTTKESEVIIMMTNAMLVNRYEVEKRINKINITSDIQYLQDWNIVQSNIVLYDFMAAAIYVVAFLFF